MNETHRIFAPPRTVRPFVIGVDFDGTVVQFAFPEIGPPLPGALETLRSIVARGSQLVLWTARRGEKRDAAVAWLKANGVEIHDVADGKPHCDVFIDDLALGIPTDARGFVDWSKVAPMLEQILG